MQKKKKGGEWGRKRGKGGGKGDARHKGRVGFGRDRDNEAVLQIVASADVIHSNHAHTGALQGQTEAPSAHSETLVLCLVFVQGKARRGGGGVVVVVERRRVGG